MRAAIAAARVGDEQLGEDPTVLELEERTAAFLGQEAAVFLPTATMANQIAIRVLAAPGEELIAEETSHVLVYEQGGVSALSGVVPRGLQGVNGRFSTAQLRAAFRDPGSAHMPYTRIVWVENTHNESGGRAWPIKDLDEVVSSCHELGLYVHLDGSRLVNAAVAVDRAPAAVAGAFDTVTFCLSKGLGCPLGALLAGSEAKILQARRAKHLFGGAMRQAGIVAAAGIYALEHNVKRIADDHARARRLAERLAQSGVAVDLEQVETNFVHIDVGRHGLTAAVAISRLTDTGVLLSGTLRPTVLRAVTHLGIDGAAVDSAAEAIITTLNAGPARVHPDTEPLHRSGAHPHAISLGDT
jgi:threonine aldolase